MESLEVIAQRYQEWLYDHSDDRPPHVALGFSTWTEYQVWKDAHQPQGLPADSVVEVQHDA